VTERRESNPGKEESREREEIDKERKKIKTKEEAWRDQHREGRERVR
jgi:hypothetical protein